MLRVDVRLAKAGVVQVDTAVAPADATFQGLAVTLGAPVHVRGPLSAAGRGTWRWAGHIAGLVRGECRRCLREVRADFEADVTAVYTTAPDVADDPGVYRLTEPVTAIDLTGAVREEVGLAAPTWLLCREDCAGLCASCGADLNEGPCECARAREPV